MLKLKTQQYVRIAANCLLPHAIRLQCHGFYAITDCYSNQSTFFSHTKPCKHTQGGIEPAILRLPDDSSYLLSHIAHIYTQIILFWTSFKTDLSRKLYIEWYIFNTHFFKWTKLSLITILLRSSSLRQQSENQSWPRTAGIPHPLHHHSVINYLPHQQSFYSRPLLSHSSHAEILFHPWTFRVYSIYSSYSTSILHTTILILH